MLFAGNFAPAGWAICAGQVMAITQNEALFALIGTIYGGDGETTFALPDLRSRAPVHMGQGGGLPNYTEGQVVGAESVTLISSHVPAHTHVVKCTNNVGTQEGPAGGIWATDASGATAEYDTPTGTVLAASAIGNAGSASPTPHNNIQPILAINFCIALFGVFPSRN